MIRGALLAFIVVSLLCSADYGFSGRRGSAYGAQRGSVRHAGGQKTYSRPASRPDGSYHRQSRRGGSADMRQTTSGNRRKQDWQAEGRYGRGARGSRDVTRDGDTLKIDKEVTTDRGASREVSKEIEFDDGRVKEIERESKTTGRYGESISRERELERKNGYWEFEGKAKTSTGRKAEMDGWAGRDIYGNRHWGAEVDTKYRGDWYARGIRGPYGGRTVAALPKGYGTGWYYGRPYYNYGGYYYRPYTWMGVTYYGVVPPPYGVVIHTVPVGATVIVVGGTSYYYHDNVYYVKAIHEGETSYKVVAAPEGATAAELPEAFATVTLDDIKYLYFHNTFYRLVTQDGAQKYVVVAQPEGVVMVEALPADFEMKTAGGLTYFVHEKTWYLPYLEPGGDEVYISVDAPAVEGDDAGFDRVGRPLAIPAGTELPVRLSTTLDSGKNKKGDRFVAFLDQDLLVNGLIVAPRGSTVHGRLVDAKKAGRMKGKAKLVLELTDLEIEGKLTPIFTNQFSVDGKSAGTLKKVGGAAALGAVIGGVADGGKGAAIGAAVGAAAGTTASAATKGKQVVLDGQVLLPFRLDRSFEATISVKVDTVAEKK
jgi:hypothetical protein